MGERDFGHSAGQRQHDAEQHAGDRDHFSAAALLAAIVFLE
jgi:hypothetical protein